MLSCGDHLTQCKFGTPQRILAPEIDGRAASFSPDSESLCVLAPDSICTFNIRTGLKTRSLAFANKFLGLIDFPGIQWRGTRIAFQHPIENALAVWNLVTGDLRLIQDDNMGDDGPCFAFSKDGPKIATGGESGVVCVWDITHSDDVPRHQFTFPFDHTTAEPTRPNSIRGIVFRDRDHILSITNDHTDVWDLAKDVHDRKTLHPESRWGEVSRYSEGKLVTLHTYGGGLNVRDVESGSSIITLTADQTGDVPPDQVSFASGSTFFSILQPSHVRIWNASEHPGDSTFQIPASQPGASGPSEPFQTLAALSKDGSLLIECYSGRNIKAIRLPSCSTLDELNIEEVDNWRPGDGNVGVFRMAMSPDSARLVTITGAQKYSSLHRVRFHYPNPVIRIWGIEPFHCLHVLLCDEIDPLSDIHFSADSSFFAVASGDDSELMIIDTHLGTIARRLLIKAEAELDLSCPPYWPPLRAESLNLVFTVHTAFLQLSDAMSVVVVSWQRKCSGFRERRRFTSWNVLTGALLGSWETDDKLDGGRPFVLPSGMIAMCEATSVIMNPVTLDLLPGRGLLIPSNVVKVGPDDR